MKVLFDKALINEVITKNIMLKIERPEHEKDHGQALTNKQQEELINTCKNIENADIILIAMYQGLRRGEVLGLTTDNIDFENNTLTIDKAFNKYNKFDTTKNKQSIRTMPLFDESKKIAKRGGSVAKDARRSVEKQIGESVISPLNASNVEQLTTKKDD